MVILIKHKDWSEIHEYVCTQNMSFCFMLDTMSPFSNINFLSLQCHFWNLIRVSSDGGGTAAGCDNLLSNWLIDCWMIDDWLIIRLYNNIIPTAEVI
jgi:hypothetical protein